MKNPDCFVPKTGIELTVDDLLASTEYRISDVDVPKIAICCILTFLASPSSLHESWLNLIPICLSTLSL